jgi:superfamily II DNA or RNA helicase
MPDFKDIKAKLAEAERVAQELDQVANLDESLIKQTKQNLSKAKESAVLQKLAELPVENLRDATDTSLRIETLRRFGLTTVAAIYHSTSEQLEKLSGISSEGAIELKFLADKMHEAIAESISYGVKIENLTVNDLNLLENVQGLERLRSKLRGNHTKLRPVAKTLKDATKDAMPLKSRWRWILAGKEKRNRALSAVSNIAFVLGDPTTAILASIASDALNYFENKQPDPVVEDFKRRSSEYYAVLEEIGGIKPQLGQRHFNKELIEKIENTEFNSQSMNATLRKYQVFGTKFALTQSRVIIGDEMGLGKTLQAIGLILQRVNEGATRFLIVCPASVLENWQREISSRTSLKTVKIHGEVAKSGLTTWIENSGIALTTFDTLKTFSMTDEEIQALQVDSIIVDEAHYVKNLEAGRTRTIVKWLDRSPRAVFLTGTPLENRVGEFVNLASLLDRDFSKRLNHAALASGVDAFRQHVAPMYLRRNTEEVLKELPELIEIDEFCNWNGADYDTYMNCVSSGNLMGMRRAGMMPNQTSLMSNKLERLLEISTEAFESGKKVIIFSYFKDVLNLVSENLGPKALGPVTGAVNPVQRQALVDKFTESAEPLALVGQIQALGTGLNIQSASVVILCEPQIKPSLEVQAIARAHRMGQVNVVQVHRLLIPESIDELMVSMLKRKQAEFDDYVKESELANSSSQAKDRGEEAFSSLLINEERKRLGITATEIEPLKDLENDPPQG